MKARLITGTVYFIVLVAVLLLRVLFDNFWGMLPIDIVSTLLALFGSFELLRATNCCNKYQKATVYVFALFCTPLYVAFKNNGIEVPGNLGVFMVCWFFILCGVSLVLIYVLNHDNSTIKGTAVALFTMVYVVILSLVLSMVNHYAINAIPAILLIFIVTPCVDVFALLFGMTLGRFIPFKLAPEVSPKKTIIGAVGGVIGGMVAGCIVCLAMYIFKLDLVVNSTIPDIVIMMLVTIPVSIIGQFGDLFESALKRECGIKDMGNILPGHGGILDRFDSTLFTAPTVALMFVLLAAL